MRTTLFITTSILSLFLLAGCEKDSDEIQLKQKKMFLKAILL